MTQCEKNSRVIFKLPTVVRCLLWKYFFQPTISHECISARLFPAYYTSNDTKSVNGSSGAICKDPASSVLFDGNIPTLTRLDGNMWASQLLTIRSSIAAIYFNFTGRSNFVGVKRIETVMFNCEPWGISVHSIVLVAGGNIAGTINPTVTSCDSLVRVCMDVNTNIAQTDLTLNFVPINPNDWMHIAEVTFYGAGSSCPPDTIFTPAPIPATTPKTITTGKQSLTPALFSMALDVSLAQSRLGLIFLFA